MRSALSRDPVKGHAVPADLFADAVRGPWQVYTIARLSTRHSVLGIYRRAVAVEW